VPERELVGMEASYSHVMMRRMKSSSLCARLLIYCLLSVMTRSRVVTYLLFALFDDSVGAELLLNYYLLYLMSI